MTLYLDASALVKLYVAESGSPEVASAVAVVESVATSAAAYAELRAAFGRARRENRLNEAALQTIVGLLDAHWPRYAVVGVDDSRLRDAGALVDRHPRHALRALDAIHLSSALRLATGAPKAVIFGCWDIRLWRAARDEGFAMLPVTEPS